MTDIGETPDNPQRAAISSEQLQKNNDEALHFQRLARERYGDTLTPQRLMYAAFLAALDARVQSALPEATLTSKHDPVRYNRFGTDVTSASSTRRVKYRFGVPEAGKAEILIFTYRINADRSDGETTFWTYSYYGEKKLDELCALIVNQLSSDS